MNLGNLSNGSFSCFWETGAGDLTPVSGGGAVGKLEMVGPDGKALRKKAPYIKVIDVEEDGDSVYIQIKDFYLNGDVRLTVVDPKVKIEKKLIVKSVEDMKVDVTGMTTFNQIKTE